MTFLLVFALLGLAWLSGAGIVWILFPSPRPAPRILLAPFAGIAFSVLSFFVLLPLNLNGIEVGRVQIALAAVLAVAGMRRRMDWSADWSEAKGALWPACGALLLIGWPLFTIGARDFLGFGNPDMSAFITRLRYFSGHSFSLPDPRFYRGFDSGAWLGVFSLIYQLTAATGVAVDELFTVTGAAFLFLGPLSVYLLFRMGLDWPRGRSLAAACLAGVSSQVAYAYFLDSLGTLTAAVWAPLTLGAALTAIRTRQKRAVVLLALLLSAAFYNYGPAFSLMALVTFGAFAAPLLRGELPLGFAAASGAVVAAAMSIPNLRYAGTVVQVARSLSSQSSLNSASNEIQTAFALMLTERVLPYFWGLNNPFLPVPRWFGSLYPAQLVLYSLSAMLFLFLAYLIFHPSSGLSRSLRGTAVCAGILLGFYYGINVGYGVFKLIAWSSLLLLSITAAGVFMAWDSGSRRLAAAGGMGLLLLGVINGAHSIELGRYAAGLDGALLSSTPGYRLTDFRALEGMPTAGEALVGLPDLVLRLWSRPYYGAQEPAPNNSINNSHFVDAGFLDYLVEDSTPMPFLPDCDSPEQLAALNREHIRCGELRAPWFLGLKPGHDITGISAQGAWSSSLFVLTRGVPPDTVLPVRGWYRPERIAVSPVAWQRRPFRWLRKRGEVFVLNPSAEPKRLRLGVVTGFGATEGARTVDILLNGKLLETFHLTASREILSAPFAIPGPVSQMELFIHETAVPMRRQVALWNSWVPSDARRLNVAITRFELVNASSPGGSGSLPASVDFTSGDGDWPVPVNGIFPDRWVSRRAEITMGIPRDPAWVEVDGFIPGIKPYKFPIPVELMAGPVSLGTQMIQVAGDFHLRAQVPPELAKSLEAQTTVVLSTPASFQPSEISSSSDSRILSFQLRKLSINSGGAAPAEHPQSK